MFDTYSEEKQTTIFTNESIKDIFVYKGAEPANFSSPASLFHLSGAFELFYYLFSNTPP